MYNWLRADSSLISLPSSLFPLHSSLSLPSSLFTFSSLFPLPSSLHFVCMMKAYLVLKVYKMDDFVIRK